MTIHIYSRCDKVYYMFDVKYTNTFVPTRFTFAYDIKRLGKKVVHNALVTLWCIKISSIPQSR